MLRFTANCCLAVLLAACSGPAPHAPSQNQAQEAVATSGDVTVRASTLQTLSLSPEVARRYGIARSENTVMLLVMTRQGASEAAVPADVQAKATDLRGQSRTLALRELRTQAGNETLIDYVGTLEISLPETLSFDINVTPRAGSTMSLQFTRDFVPR